MNGTWEVETTGDPITVEADNRQEAIEQAEAILEGDGTCPPSPDAVIDAQEVYEP